MSTDQKIEIRLAEADDCSDQGSRFKRLCPKSLLLKFFSVQPLCPLCLGGCFF